MPRPGLALALLLVTLAGGTAADEGEELARSHFNTGVVYFDRGEYRKALREFEAAREARRGRSSTTTSARRTRTWAMRRRARRWSGSAAASASSRSPSSRARASPSTASRRSSRAAASRRPSAAATTSVKVQATVLVNGHAAGDGQASYALDGGAALAETLTINTTATCPGGDGGMPGGDGAMMPSVAFVNGSWAPFTQTTATLTVSAPQSVPPGDFLFLVVSVDAAPGVVNTPAGWTPFLTWPTLLDNSNQPYFGLAFFTRVADESDGKTPMYHLDFTGMTDAAAVVVALRGTGLPDDRDRYLAVAPAVGNSYQLPPQVASGPGDIGVIVAAKRIAPASDPVWTPPPGFTAVRDHAPLGVFWKAVPEGSMTYGISIDQPGVYPTAALQSITFKPR